MTTTNTLVGTQSLQGNQPLLLNDPDRLWIVNSGSLTLFMTQVKDGEPGGSRRYLFSVAAGEALVGHPLVEAEGSTWGIVAIAANDTVLQVLPTEAVIARMLTDSPNFSVVFSSWLSRLGRWIQAQSALVAPLPATPCNLGRYSLQPGASVQSATGLSWATVEEGQISLLGLESFVLGENSVCLPLVPDLWITASTSVLVSLTAVPLTKDPQAILTALHLTHQSFYAYWQQVNQIITAQEQQQFQARQQLNRKATTKVLNDLLSVLEPDRAQKELEGPPILIAVGAISRLLNIPVMPPAQAERLQQLSDPLEAIARTSGFQTRKIALVGEWWNDEYIPMLAYTKVDQAPVALLPGKQTKYEAFDATNGTRQPVGAGVADQLKPEAYQIYPPMPRQVRNVLELVMFSLKGHEIDLLIIFGLGLMISLLGLVTPQVTAMLINRVIPAGDHRMLLEVGLALVATAFGTAIFQLSQGLFTLRAESSADSTMQVALWDRLLKLSPPFFRDYSSGDLLNRLLTVRQIRQQLSGATMNNLLSGTTALMNLVMMLVHSGTLTLIGMGLAIVNVIITIASSKLTSKAQKQVQMGAGQLSGLVVQLINGVPKLRVAAAEERAFATWAKPYQALMQSRIKTRIINGYVSTINGVLPLLSSTLIFGFAYTSIKESGSSSGLALGSFLAFNAAFGTFLGGVTTLSSTINSLSNLGPLWGRAKPIVNALPEDSTAKIDPGVLTGRILVDRLSFRYRKEGSLVLDRMSLQVEPGEFVAIVGPSGSGKSTIIRMLLGFETPTAGNVYYDGHDLAELSLQSVRRQIGVVLQAGKISTGSIFDNIACGAIITLEEAWEAVRISGFAADIEQMPMGMHTVINEGGTNLSGGQRQRLLIARSLVLQPKIIFMDEATSALDNLTQAIVSKSMEKLKATRIVIAHRLSTIQNADRIFVISDGQVVQSGTFQQLKSQDGLFARLIARQME